MKQSAAALALMLPLCVSAGWSATRTVAKTGTPDFGTIQAAIDFFRTSDPDPGTTDTISITDSAVYDEAINVNASVIIQGTAATRPTITAQPATTQATGDSGGNDGIVIEIAGGGNVTLKNLIVLPSIAVPIPDDTIRCAAANHNVTLDNILVAPNNGSNAPVSNGLTEADLTAPGVVRLGDDGVFLTSAGGTMTLKNTVITHANNPTGAGLLNTDGLVCSGGTTNYLIQDGCIFSYCNRVGIQMGGLFKIDAPTTRVLVLGNKGFAGIWGASTAGGSVRQANGVNLIGNGLPYVSGATVGGWGIEVQNGDGVTPFTLSNAIATGNGGPGIRLGEAFTNGGLIMTNVTSANNGKAVGASEEAPLIVSAAAIPSAGNITITNSILAGNGTSDASNKINHNGTGVMTLTGSALVLSGPYALTSPGFQGPGTVNVGTSKTQDPNFSQTNNQALSTFFDVNNSVYANASSTNGPLGGGADYVGPAAPAAAADWNLFE